MDSLTDSTSHSEDCYNAPCKREWIHNGDFEIGSCDRSNVGMMFLSTSYLDHWPSKLRGS